MINIISTSLNKKGTRGPKKVVENLIKGLEQIKYPFVINRELDACARLWIHDDVYAVTKLAYLYQKAPYVHTLIGPNLFINPEHIPQSLDLSKTVYIQPSSNVVEIWRARGYQKSPLDIWPVGIDTDTFIPSTQEKQIVTVYFKHRNKIELKKVTDILQSKKIKFEILSYGSYTEDQYKKTLDRTRYILWIGSYESQGIALEEALSSNIPVLVIEKESPDTSYDTQSTSAPYFSPECGLKIKGCASPTLEHAIDMMEQQYLNFFPRQYALEHLELKKQARAFVDLYDKHFGMNFEMGLKELPQNNRTWRGQNLFRKIVSKLTQ